MRLLARMHEKRDDKASLYLAVMAFAFMGLYNAATILEEAPFSWVINSFFIVLIVGILIYRKKVIKPILQQQDK